MNSRFISVWGSSEDGTEVMELRSVEEIPAGVEIAVDYIGDRSFLCDPEERSR